jgi:hypothetical protein
MKRQRLHAAALIGVGAAAGILFGLIAWQGIDCMQAGGFLVAALPWYVCVVP